MFEKKVVEEEKKKENKKQKRKEEVIGIRSFIIPAAFAGVLVVSLFLVISSAASNKEVLKPVVVATREINANTYIDEGDIDDYFKEEMVDAKVVPKTAVTSIKQVKQGIYIEEMVSENEMLHMDSFAKSKKALTKYEKSYSQTSIVVDTFASSVDGTLREGDIVDVYAPDPESDVLTKMASNVYIKAAYDSSGGKIEGEEGSATSFIVYVAKGEEDSINKAISYGGIQLYKKR